MEKPSPCGEGILPLFFAAGKMLAGRKAGTASPQTTIGMRLPPNRIDGKGVAASSGSPLGTPYGDWGWSRIPEVG